MADYGGYFLKGLAGGIQSGINMGQQLQEMKWQKKQKKLLEEKQAKMLEVGDIFNAKVKEFGADNTFSDEEVAQLTTIFLSGGYEFREHYDGAMQYISGMNEKRLKEEFEWMDLFIESTSDMNPSDISGIYDTFENQFIKSEKGKTFFEANRTIQQKKYDIAQAQPTAEVFPSAAAAQEAYPDAEITFNASAGGFVPKISPVAPTTKKAPTAIDQKIAGIDNLPIPENQKLKMKIKVYGGGDTALEQKIEKAYEHGATDEEVKEMIVGGGINIVMPPTVGTIGSWEERFETAKTKGAYNRELANLAQSKDKDTFTPPYPDWKGRLMALVKERAETLKWMLNEKGELKDASDEDVRKDWGKMVDAYKENIMELQRDFPEVDLSKFPKFRGEKRSILTIPYGGYIDEKGW